MENQESVLSNFGLRRVLEIPGIYILFQQLFGGSAARKIIVSEYLFPVPGQKILDIGCGPAQILEDLGDVEYFGFDSDPHYIRHATKTYGARGTFSTVELASFIPTHRETFDTVIALGVLHHLDDADAGRLYNLAYSALKPGGRLVTMDGCYVAGQSRVAKYLLKKDRGKHVRNGDGYLKILKKTFSAVRASYRDDLTRFPYNHIIIEAVKEAKGVTI